MNLFTKSGLKVALTTILFWGCILGLLLTISGSSGGVFFGSEPLIISVIVWTSLIVFMSSLWTVSIRPYLSIRIVGLGFAGLTLLWVILTAVSGTRALGGLLRVVSGIVMMGLLFMLVYFKLTAYLIYRNVTSRRINMSGTGMVGIGTAGVCALLTSVTLMKTPLQCEMIYEWYDKVIESSLAPVYRPQQGLESLGEQSVFSFLQELQSDSESSSGSVVPSSDTSRRSSVQSTFTQAKVSLIDETLEQRSLVTQNICELILGQIEEIRKTATRNISIVVLLFAVLSPLITLWLRIVSYISWGIFRLLQVAGVFHAKTKHITIKEVE